MMVERKSILEYSTQKYSTRIELEKRRLIFYDTKIFIPENNRFIDEMFTV